MKKPPLPPRPGVQPNAPAAGSGSGSRISGFASLFGVKANSSPVPSSSPPPTLTTQELKTSPATTPSLSEKENPVTEPESYPLQIYTAPSPIPRSVGAEVNETLKAEIRASIPAEVVDTVLNFVDEIGLLPFKIDPEWIKEKEKARVVKSGKAMGIVAGRSHSQNSKKEEEDGERWIVSEAGLGVEEIDVVGEKFQAFYNTFPSPQSPTSLTSRESMLDSALERTEAILTTLFYNTLFLQPTPSSTDSAHDEVLAERVAALNMLDLGLEHLGIDLPKGTGVKEGVEAVVKGCGYCECILVVNTRMMVT